jgi:hypothetical protein
MKPLKFSETQIAFASNRANCCTLNYCSWAVRGITGITLYLPSVSVEIVTGMSASPGDRRRRSFPGNSISTQRSTAVGAHERYTGSAQDKS